MADFVAAVVSSAEAHRCFFRQWLSYPPDERGRPALVDVVSRLMRRILHAPVRVELVGDSVRLFDVPAMDVQLGVLPPRLAAAVLGLRESGAFGRHEFQIATFHNRFAAFAHDGEIEARLDRLWMVQNLVVTLLGAFRARFGSMRDVLLAALAEQEAPATAGASDAPWHAGLGAAPKTLRGLSSGVRDFDPRAL